LKETALYDTDTIVKREAVSSIGEMRSIKGKDILFESLTTKTRKYKSSNTGLLYFKEKE